MYADNKYTKWYYNIISNARLQDRSKKDCYYESHHIIPKSFGGANTNANLVLLTPREHFLCHLLLPKMMLDPVKAGKMVYAFFRMKHKHKNSKIFDRFRTAYGKLTTGENNPFYGKKHSQETIQRISGENHPLYGKNHRADSIQKMRDAKIGKGVGKDNSMYGKEHPAEWRAAHSAKMSGENHFNYGKPAFNKGRVWVNNTTTSKMISPEQLTEFLDNGWAKGRLWP